MKILYVSAIELDADGGPKTHIIEMLREWHKLGHEIVLLTPPYNRERLNLQVNVVFYPFFGYSFFRRIISYHLMFVFLVWCICKFRPTIVYERKMKYIGYVGTFSHLDSTEKIIESFIKIAQKMPEALLVMVGDGPGRKDCQKIIADINLTERVIFTGLVNYEDVPIYINCFDIGMVSASKRKLEREGLIAFRLQEFLACGCPTIAHYKNPKDYDQFCLFVKMVYIEDKLALSDAVIELLED